MEEAFGLACSCAHRLVCEVVRQGERLGILSFFDDEPDSQTRGEKVLECPGCGEWLGLAMLFATGPANRVASRAVSRTDGVRLPPPEPPWPQGAS